VADWQDSIRWWNRVYKRRRRKALAEHHRKVIRAVAAAKAAGVTCPPHPKRPKDWL
jgi:hypothetical protein